MVRRRLRRAFRPDIEGLRAVAVVAVVAFHAGGLRGGFVGVDVFFVISGFLITGLLWAELRETGRLDMARFYAARARRLLPAAAIVLVATGVAAVALMPPLQARSVLNDGLASALYIGNYRFAIIGTDYLANTTPSPYQHYWSLGVEEQFYLLWPALLLAAAWLWQRRSNATLYAGTLLVVGGVSLALSLAWTRTVPSWAFFSLPTRAWELAAGGVIALSARKLRRLPAGAAALAGLIGLALIGWACVHLDQTTAYPGTAALLPVAGAVLVIGAGCATPTRGAGRLLALPAARAIGRVSYSWYLWHWPVLVFAPLLVGRPLGGPGLAVAVTASLVLALLTLRYVERPVRYSAPLRRSSVRSLALGSAVTAAAVSAALLLPMFVRTPVGHGVPAAAAVVRQSGDPLTVAVAAVRNAITASAAQDQVPADLAPPLTEAATDKPSVFLDGCVRTWREVGVPECVSGDQHSPKTVALVGDSHAAMWQPAFDPVAQQQHWRLVTMAKVTCPLQGLPISSPYLGRHYDECEQWRTQVSRRLAAERPSLVVVSMSRRYGSDFGFDSYDRAWVRSLKKLVVDLRATTGARVLVLGPVPDPHAVVPVCLSDHLNDALACAPQRIVALNADGIAAEAEAVHKGGGQYADLSQLFCTAERCPVIVGSDLAFRDDNHVTVTYAQRLSSVLGLIAQRTLAPSS
ncbi:MAG: acyltransferase family protein [Mycobacterium sp.]